jgi:hypothetical protein
MHGGKCDSLVPPHKRGGVSVSEGKAWMWARPISFRVLVHTVPPLWPRYLCRGRCRAACRRPLHPAPSAPDEGSRVRVVVVVNRAPLLRQLEVTRSDTPPTAGSGSSCPLSSALDGTPRVRCRRGPAAAPMAWRRQRRRARRARRGGCGAPRRSRRTLRGGLLGGCRRRGRACH